jgi:pimeloyl-ACP methyl ester carboxylesterase
MSPEKSTIDRLKAAPIAASPTLGARPGAALRRPSTEPTAAAEPTTRAADEPPAVPVPRGARRLFGTLERTSPALAGLLAERLWFRLPPAPASARRAQRTPAGGEPFELPWVAGPIRGRVYGHWGNPTAYLVHGWGGWWQQLGAHVEPLVAAGLCVVAMDLPGHGDSGPGRHGRRSTDVIEMAEALAAVVREFGRPTLVVAHSLGAMATMHALRLGVRPQAYAFLAPPLAAEPMVSLFADALGVGPRSRAELHRRIEARAGHRLADLDLVTVAAEQANLPDLLVVHDRGDRETAASGSVGLTTAWHDARLLLTDGLGHRRVLWEPAVVERVTDSAVRAAAAVRRSSR